MPFTQPSRPFAAIVLAAGKSTRMKSKTPKALHPIAGLPVIRHILDALREAGAARIVVVTGAHSDQIRAALGDSVEYAEQTVQKGTGHAALMAAPALSDWRDPVVVLPGDAPLITSDAISSLIESHQNQAVSLLTARLKDPTGYGRVIRDASGAVSAIVEHKDATEEQRKVDEVNVSIYAFDTEFLFDSLAKITPNNIQGEYYLTDVVSIARSQNLPVGALLWSDSDAGRGINTRVELAEASEILRRRILKRLMLDGVTIIDPASTFIDASVRIGQDTTIFPFTIITGDVSIGEDCLIGPGARISNSHIASSVKVKDSYIDQSSVGEGSTVGPFANLRPGSVIGRFVKIGDFVETKQSTLEDHVSAGHFTYLGNAVIGAGTNIGAGTITCNYDGKDKHQTTIGENAFIGSNSTLVAPVEIGGGAFVAAGSTITKQVPEDALAVGRSRQCVKEEWAKGRPMKRYTGQKNEEK
jgi:bifunctional UDP-N-acetylglucosamine pyrophosphorylase/glucosamine-1-phosphate N-acetyltransferase